MKGSRFPYRSSLRIFGIRLLIFSASLLSQRVESIFVHGNSLLSTNANTVVPVPGLKRLVPAPMSVTTTVSKPSPLGRASPVTSSPEINDTDDALLSSSETLLVLRLAQCRANCLKKFTNGSLEENFLTENALVEQCWTTCHHLEIETNQGGKQSLTCSNTSKSICLTGCQEACRFHVHNEMLKDYQIMKKTLETLRVLPVIPSLTLLNNHTLRWPASQFCVSTLVRQTSESWEILGQTALNTLNLTGYMENLKDVRVLVMSSTGLRRVYRLPEEQLTDGIKVKVHPANWTIKLHTLIHQKYLVLAELSWELPADESITTQALNSGDILNPSKPEKLQLPYHIENSSAITHQGSNRNGSQQDFNSIIGNPKPIFLLTWEVYHGLVRGNLVTDATAVTISLWPDTAYTIQVSLVDESKLNQDNKTIPALMKLLSSGKSKRLPVTHRSRALSLNTSRAGLPKPGMLVADKNHSNKMTAHPVQDQLATQIQTCILIWVIFLVCLLSVFLMLLYFTVAVYRSLKQQTRFHRLNSTCSVSSIADSAMFGFGSATFRRDLVGREDSFLFNEDVEDLDCLN